MTVSIFSALTLFFNCISLNKNALMCFCDQVLFTLLQGMEGSGIRGLPFSASLESVPLQELLLKDQHILTLTCSFVESVRENI